MTAGILALERADALVDLPDSLTKVLFDAGFRMIGLTHFHDIASNVDKRLSGRGRRPVAVT